MLIIAFFFSFLYSLSTSALGDSTVARERTFFAMGSELTLFSDRGESFYDEASKSLQSFEKNISTWNKASRLFAFNQSSQKWVSFDQQSYQALKNAVACSKLTNGYFHPGLGQLIQLWGLRTKLNNPAERERELALAHSELSTLAFKDAGYKIKKREKAFWFEEGGFAKGAAMDEIVKLAEKAQGEDLFLNFSGQIFSAKKREIGIADPEQRMTAVISLDIENESLSTSSIGLQHFTHEKINYGHILNPKTGLPLNHTLKSVTVIHPENARADCLSTGLLVMSENRDELRSWMKNHPETKVLLLEKKEGKLMAETSCGLKKKIKINESQNVSQIFENC